MQVQFTVMNSPYNYDNLDDYYFALANISDFIMYNDISLSNKILNREEKISRDTMDETGKINIVDWVTKNIDVGVTEKAVLSALKLQVDTQEVWGTIEGWEDDWRDIAPWKYMSDEELEEIDSHYGSPSFYDVAIALNHEPSRAKAIATMIDEGMRVA